MAVSSAQNILQLKSGAVFEHEDARIDKYSLSDKLPAQLSQLSLRPRMLSPTPAHQEAGYSVRRLTIGHKEAVLDFLRRFFFRDEPLNEAVRLLERPDDRCVELEEFCVTTLRDGVSVAAYGPGNEIVGILLNGLSRRPSADQQQEDESEECQHAKFRRILAVLSHLDTHARVWTHLPGCRLLLDHKIAGTHSAWRGKGLMKALCLESERVARDMGATALRIDCTSAFSAAIAQKLNFREIYTVRYADLPGAPVPPPPHVEAKVYVKEI